MVEAMDPPLAQYPNGTSFTDWQNIGAAETSFVVDASAFPSL